MKSNLKTVYILFLFSLISSCSYADTTTHVTNKEITNLISRIYELEPSIGWYPPVIKSESQREDLKQSITNLRKEANSLNNKYGKDTRIIWALAEVERMSFNLDINTWDDCEKYFTQAIGLDTKKINPQARIDFARFYLNSSAHTNPGHLEVAIKLLNEAKEILQNNDRQKLFIVETNPEAGIEKGLHMAYIVKRDCKQALVHWKNYGKLANVDPKYFDDISNTLSQENCPIQTLPKNISNKLSSSFLESIKRDDSKESKMNLNNEVEGGIYCLSGNSKACDDYKKLLFDKVELNKHLFSSNPSEESKNLSLFPIDFAKENKYMVFMPIKKGLFSVRPSIQPQQYFSVFVNKLPKQPNNKAEFFQLVEEMWSIQAIKGKGTESSTQYIQELKKQFDSVNKLTVTEETKNYVSFHCTSASGEPVMETFMYTIDLPEDIVVSSQFIKKRGKPLSLAQRKEIKNYLMNLTVMQFKETSEASH